MEHIVDLDEVVLESLKFLSRSELPMIPFDEFKRPLVVGSGNAEVIGKILFRERYAIFASESEFEFKLKTFPEIDGVYLISASGKKHAPIIESKVTSFGMPLKLITCNPLSLVTDKVVFPKMSEPYTYNVSTYLGMILAKTGESPVEILNFIDKMSIPEFGGDKYVFILPDRFSELRRMFQIKFMELFGRNVAVSVETESFVSHAVMLVPANEKVIRFGVDIPLPENASFGAMMAVGYSVIGKIQKSLPSYFKDNIEEYCKKISIDLGEEIKPMVE